MMFCGVYCCKLHIDITVLTNDFEYLASKKFSHNDIESIGPWIDSLKALRKERCVYFLNDTAGNKCLKFFSLISHANDNFEVYYIPDRKIFGILYFLYHHYHSVRMVDQFYFSQSYILASSSCLFGLNELKPHPDNLKKAKIDPSLF